METTASATRRGIAIGLTLALMAGVLWSATQDRADAAAPAAAVALAQVNDNGDQIPVGYAGDWFARYDGVDGESNDADHDKCIDILAYDWGLQKPGGAATGQTRRRGSAILDPFVLTFDYEKASPKLLEKCFRGEIIPKLEVELTTIGSEEGRVTYLKYEMKNVGCEAYMVGGVADGTRPTVVVSNNFEEIKVTYTEFDNEGNPQGNVETTLKVEKGL